ncbi:MAG: hypothetical protein IJY01_04585 [Clostridia bacterium]|nr:hypothetical protein [Clostridia bacterium]
MPSSAPPSPLGKKEPFGAFDNVFLSDIEYNAFREKFPEDYVDRIDELSIYLATSGKEYKNHYATLLSFARMRYGGRASSFNMGNACEAEEIPTHSVAAAPFDFGHSPPLRMTFPRPYQPDKVGLHREATSSTKWTSSAKRISLQAPRAHHRTVCEAYTAG